MSASKNGHSKVASLDKKKSSVNLELHPTHKKGGTYGKSKKQCWSPSY